MHASCRHILASLLAQIEPWASHCCRYWCQPSSLSATKPQPPQSSSNVGPSGSYKGAINPNRWIASIRCRHLAALRILHLRTLRTAFSDSVTGILVNAGDELAHPFVDRRRCPLSAQSSERGGSALCRYTVARRGGARQACLRSCRPRAPLQQ